MLMRKGVNRPVMKLLCVWGVFASMNAWSQEGQRHQDCLSKRAAKATEQNKKENRSSMKPDIFKHIIRLSVLIHAMKLLTAVFFTIKEIKPVED